MSHDQEDPVSSKYCVVLQRTVVKYDQDQINQSTINQIFIFVPLLWMAVNTYARGLCIAGKAWIKWFDKVEVLSDLPHLFMR